MFQEKEPKIEPEAKEEKTPEEILRRAIESIKLEEEISRAEDEAYREKEERESKERAKKEAQERYERTSGFAKGEGANTYMAINVAEKLKEIRDKGERLDYEIVEDETKNGLEYLKKFDGEYLKEGNFREKIEGARFGGGAWLHFGAYTAEVKEKFDRESYFKTMGELKEHLDKKWGEKAEKVKKDEILAIWEKTEKGAFQKHLEGFGVAALDHEDLGTAVQAFVEGSTIEDPEIAKRVAEKMKEMIKSERPEVRAKAFFAKESLEKYFEGKKEKKEE